VDLGAGFNYPFLTQKERDNETGLDYFGERYYASTMGRFTTVDPLGASAKRVDPQTMNRYTYALNNPLRYVDPDGLDSWDELTRRKQSLIKKKLVLKKGETYRSRFDQLVKGADSKATAANTQSVKLFIGAVAKTDAWQQIKSIERVDSNGSNERGEAYTSNIGVQANGEGLLKSLGNKGYEVNGGGDEVRKALQTAQRNVVPFLISLVVPGFPSTVNSPDHPFDNARASTALREDPQLHFYNEQGGDHFQAHWDPTSSNAVPDGLYGNFVGGMGHGNPATINQVNDYLKKTQKSPR